MFTIKQPQKIIFGKNSAKQFEFPKNPLVISSNGCTSRKWIEYMSLKDFILFDEVEPNPSIGTVEKILSKFAES